MSIISSLLRRVARIWTMTHLRLEDGGRACKDWEPCDRETDDPSKVTCPDCGAVVALRTYVVSRR